MRSAEVVPGEEVGRGLEGVVGDDVEQDAGAGVDVGGESQEEAVLEAAMLGVVVVGRIEEEDGGAGRGRKLREEAEGVGVVGAVAVGEMGLHEGIGESGGPGFLELGSGDR